MLENWIISGVVSRKRSNMREMQNTNQIIRIPHSLLLCLLRVSLLSTYTKHGFYNTYNVTQR